MLPTGGTVYLLLILGNFVTAFGQECEQRDEVAAGRDCERACSPDGTCRKQNRECVCDGLCGLSCIRKRCPLLSAPLNGNVVMNLNDATIGAEAIYSCDEGYEISGHTNRVCQANKTWSATQPTCTQSHVQETCNEDELPFNDWEIEFTYPAGSSENVQLSQGKPPGTIARFKCNQVGYAIVGSNAKVCREGGWHVPESTCERIRCTMMELNGGTLEYRDEANRIVDQPHHGDVRIATCPDGFTLSGISQTLCSAGVWLNELPTCQQNIPLCSIETIANGNVTLQNGRNTTEEASHGDWRHFTCEQGYTIVGEQRSQCIDGEWTVEKPTCVEDEQCVRNEQEVQDQNRRCKRQCGSDSDCRRGRHCVCDDICGLSCIPTDRANYCEDLQSDQTVRVRIIPSNRTFGSIAQSDCRTGYDRVSGSNERKCLGSGQWSGDPLRCIPRATCRIESIANGDTTRRDGSQFTQDARHDEWRRVICDDGYTIVGQMWSICRSGRWSPDSPTCEETQCPAVENNGEYERILYHGQESAAQSFPSGTVLEIDCAEGRVPEGPKISSCWRGLWDPPILLCVHTGCASGCQVPHLQNGYFTTTHDWTRLQPMACVSFESYISVRCQEGMIREGDRYYRCDESGEWSNPSGIDSTCRLCPSTHCVVPYIENGHYTYSTGGAPLVNGSCFANRRYLYVVCDDGMQRIGERYYYCRDGELDTRNDGNVFTLCTTGSSSEREQICPSPGEENLVEMFIGNDYTPLNEQDSFREGDFITSRCQNPKTQQLHGSLRRQCEGGQWSGDPARCVLTNFEIFVGNTASQNVTENGTVIVYPVRGYVNIDCKLLNGLRGTISMYKDNVQLPSFYVGSGRNHRRLRIINPSDGNSGTYRCEFNRQSLTIVILFKDIRCPPLENPARGTWTHQTAPTNPGGNLGYIFMETLSLNCNLGYRPSHSARPTCSYHGTWINMSHTCIRQD